MAKLGYLAAFVVSGAGFAGSLRGGAGVLAGVVLSFVVVPVADALMGLDAASPSPEETRRLQRSFFLRALPLAWIPAQLLILGWGLWRVHAGLLDAPEAAGLAFSLGVTTGGIGITVAHELGHKPGGVERAGGLLLLATVGYMHFSIEHVQGHHVRVATPEDPATARRGESYWRFWVRTVPAQWRSAWRLEARRLERAGRGVWSARNRMLWFTAVPVALLGAVGAGWGAGAAAVWAGQAVVAFSLLEAVNYIEHYGLERREIAPGRYEPVTHLHSWNSSFRLTNWLLFMLQRHSDHHAHAARRYQVLRHFDDSPQLPAGYATMVLVAMVPPLWRRVMDPRLEAFRAARASAVPA